MITTTTMRKQQQQHVGVLPLWIAIYIPFFLLLQSGLVQSFCPRVTTTVQGKSTKSFLSPFSQCQHQPLSLLPQKQQRQAAQHRWLQAASGPNFPNAKSSLGQQLKSRLTFWKRHQRQQQQQSVDNNNPLVQHQQQQRTAVSLFQPISRLLSSGWRRVRRATVVVSMATFIWMASSSWASASTAATTSAAAVSTSAPITQVMAMSSTRKISETSADRIVNQYIQEYMFDDDVYDPFESSFREAYDDVTKGTYPRKLADVTSTLLGRQGVTGSVSGTSSSTTSGTPEVVVVEPYEDRIGRLLVKTIRLMQKRLGLSEATAVAVIAATFVVAGPSLFLFFGMVVGGISKRNINRVMKQRYGDTYTVDATIKQVEEVEVPDEDDDEDDDDDDEDDENDDDDDEDEDDKKKKKKDNKKKK